MEKSPDPVAALDAFIEASSFPAEAGLVVRNLADHPVRWRADRGNSAAYFSFPGLKTLEAHVSELGPGQITQTHRHRCEALFYVLAGHGCTTLWAEGQPQQQIAWQAGDLFFTPTQVWHRHQNTDSLLAARYLEITTIPLMKSLGAWSLEVAAPAQKKRPRRAR